MNIRLAAPSDAAEIAQIYRPIVLATAISFETDPPDEQEIAGRIKRTLPAFPWLVCESNGHIVGYAYGGSHRTRAAYRWSVETSVYVHAEFRQRGIGKGLYVSLFRILAAQGYFHAFAGITLPNPGSIKLHESAGFKPIGSFRNVGYKFGCWQDVGWWQLTLRPVMETPGAVMMIEECQDIPEWGELLAAGLEHIHDQT